MGSQSHYPPLRRQPGRDTFRLLLLEPGQAEDSITCQLRTVSVSESESQDEYPTYEAVSHVWGSKDATFPIRLGAWSVPVRENLYRFLKQIRSPDKSLTLWIDALTINQLSFDERAYQVQIMDKIYKGARRALVWLGTEDNEGLLAMDLIEQISETPSSAAHISFSDYMALQSWAQRSYWTRTWVVQEFLLSQDVSFILGSRRLEWSTVSKFIYYIQRELYEDPSWSAFIKSPAYTLMRQRRTVERRLQAPLARLLVQNQHTECGDPHDKVYAMLGLAIQSEDEGKIRPSYKKGLPRLVFDVLEHCRIPDTNVARYVRFLVELLKIDRDKIMSSSLGPGINMPNRNSWNLTAFSTGRIINCNMYYEQFSPAEALYGDSQNSSDMLRGLRDYSVANVSRMLRDLEQLSLARLQSAYSSLESLYGQGEGSETVTLVVVLSSGCDEPEVLLGLAVGCIRKGDGIAHFLGHHVGLVIDQSEREAESPRVAGMVVCARTNDNTAIQDTLTKQISKYWTVQTESDLGTPVARVPFSLSPREVLRLGQ